LTVGCSRPPTPGKFPGSIKSSTPENAVQTALDSLSRAGALADYKEALHLVNKHLSRPENRDAIQLSKEDRQALINQFGLEKEELEAVEARTFRPLDAHHLEMCFLLRDVARNLGLDQRPSLEPVEQAQLALAWVDRKVLLRESSGALLPPLYVLRTGQGSTRERALVLLSLLEQFRIPACVVLWPDAKQPGLLLVGVIAARGKQKDIVLFDPRLGRPVPGPDGIATLAQLRQDPTLFPVGGSQSESRPEAYLACSLSALSPRMKYLQDKLTRSDRIVLAEAPALRVEQVKAAASDMKVWDIPLRVLAAFLPEAEGGTDKSGRQAKFEVQRMPMLGVVHNYAAMKLFGEDMPVKQAQVQLLNFAHQLFTKYAAEPHALLLKGQNEKAIKRLQVMRTALDDVEFSPLPEFGKRVNLWRDAVIRNQLAFIHKKQGAKEAIDALWNRDQYLLTLLNAQESPDPQKHAKEELTYIVLTAVKDSLEEQTLYLLAEAWQDKAERSQATWRRHKKAGKAEGHRAKEAHESWSNARGWWKKYEERYPLAWSGLESRFRALQLQWHRGEQEKALSQWDFFLAEIHRAAAARLFLVRACQHLGLEKEAMSTLVKLDEDLTSLLEDVPRTGASTVGLIGSPRGEGPLLAATTLFPGKPLLENAEIKKEFVSALETVRNQANSVQGAILENLARDLGPNGGFFWLRKKARGQLQQLLDQK
jgi:hypothetical protein